MVATTLIVVVSIALFVYWFRYSVLLLLREEQVEQTREVLRQQHGDLPLDRLHRALNQDYRVLQYLLRHAAGLSLRPSEHYPLVVDYQMMQVWYRLTPNRRALDEMAGVVSYIACKMGERTA
jgi:hypothetical protein